MKTNKEIAEIANVMSRMNFECNTVTYDMVADRMGIKITEFDKKRIERLLNRYE